MSWIESVNKDFVLTTGDNEKFTPNWLNAKRAVDFNIAVFNFKNVKGSRVDRGEPEGRIYDLEIYFQGTDNLVTAAKFMDSAEDKRPWQISHPMYGQLFVQPFGVVLDDKDYNVTKVSSRVMQTIGAQRVKLNIDPVDTIQAKKLDTDITTATAYAVNVPTAFIDDVTEMQEKSSTLEKLQLAFVTISENAQQVVNTYNRANAAIDNAFSDSFAAVRAIQDLINLPATFVNTIGRRVNFLLNASLNLYAALTGLTTPRLKRLYELNIATIVTTMCSASVTNPTPLDYRNRADVIKLVDDIVIGYNTFIVNLDSIQTDTGDAPDSYVPDFDTMFKLKDLVTFTVANLFNIASDAQQQRTYRTEKDTNIILMADRFYGMLPDDSTIDRVIAENNICLNELLIIKKGRDLVYYV